MEDMVNHPKHYEDGCSIECIHMMWTVLGLKGVIMFCLGNAYKYLWRHKLKNNPEEDLAKAKWYIDEASGMMGDLYDEDPDLYEWIFPRLCEILRVHSLYSIRNSSSKEIIKKLDEMGSNPLELTSDVIKKMNEVPDYAKHKDFWDELEHILKRKGKENEDRKDWEQVYHDIKTICNNLPDECMLDHDIDIEIGRTLAISKIHCETDS